MKTNILMIIFLQVLFVSQAYSSAVDAIRNVGSYASSGSSKNNIDTDEFIKNYAKIAYLSYKNAFDKAQVMQTAITGFLNKPSKESLAKAKHTWIEARKAYLQTEVFRFYEGPIDFGSEYENKTMFIGYEEGPEGRINAWPLNESYIDYVVGKKKSGIINDLSITLIKDSILSKDQISDEANVTTGWHAIEFLLWGQDFNKYQPGIRSIEDYISKENYQRRKTYLKLVTEILVDDLAWLSKMWNPNEMQNYYYWFTKLEKKEAMGRILTGMATLVGFEMASERLSVALDGKVQENEQSCFSDTTHLDFIYDFQGIKNIYLGNYEEFQGEGLNIVVKEVMPLLDQLISEKINQISSLLLGIASPFDQTIISPEGNPDRKHAERTYRKLMELTELISSAGNLLGAKVVIITE